MRHETMHSAYHSLAVSKARANWRKAARFSAWTETFSNVRCGTEKAIFCEYQVLYSQVQKGKNKQNNCPSWRYLHCDSTLQCLFIGDC